MIYVWIALLAYACIGIGVAFGVLVYDESLRNKYMRLIFWCAAFWPLAHYARNLEDDDATKRHSNNSLPRKNY